MGHKVHPTIHRTPTIFGWDSKWFGRRQYPQFSREDITIRAYLAKKLREAQIEAVSIERGGKQMTVTILAAKPGVIIGRGGQGLDIIRKDIERTILGFKMKVKLNVQEVRNPILCANVVAQGLASEIERRMPFRRAMKQAMEKILKAGAKGVKISMSGRLNGAEIARREVLAQGTLPLITIRSDVDYALVEAQTTYGKIGIKVWICHGEVFGRKDKFAVSTEESDHTQRRAPRRGRVDQETRDS